MAAKGFIELLRLADYGRRQQQGTQDNQLSRWSGVGFIVAGIYCIAPLGEISEVIVLPPSTLVPGASHWLKGLANVRGRLLPLAKLAEFMALTDDTHHQSKVLVIDYLEHYSGLIVEQVLGIQHFNKQSYFGHNHESLPQSLTSYCQGYFEKQGQIWHVFLPSRLINDQRYRHAAA